LPQGGQSDSLSALLRFTGCSTRLRKECGPPLLLIPLLGELSLVEAAT